MKLIFLALINVLKKKRNKNLSSLNHLSKTSLIKLIFSCLLALIHMMKPPLKILHLFHLGFLSFTLYPADNILLRKDSPYIAVTDFGASRRLHNPKELKNKSPVGSPTHWSPEKASMEGHGFPSDLWAAVCVLVQMLSGEPPWLRRFQDAGMLNWIVSSCL